jgi:hypothetical protein
MERTYFLWMVAILKKQEWSMMLHHLKPSEH